MHQLLYFVSRSHPYATGIPEIFPGVIPQPIREGEKSGKEENRRGRERKRGRGKKEKRRETRAKEWEVNVLPTLSIPEIRRPVKYVCTIDGKKNELFTIGAKIFGCYSIKLHF